MTPLLTPLRLVCFCVFLFLPSLAQAAGELEVKDAYAFATAPGQKNGAVFLRIENHSAAAARITAAKADIAETVELHTHIMSDGVMMMRPVEGYDVPADGAHVLKPMDDHIMLMGLKARLETGEHFDLTLVFDHHEPLVVPVAVRAPGAMH